MRRNKIIYWICVGDIQDAAEEMLERKLNDNELKKVIDKFPDYIPWFDAIEYAFDNLGLKPKDEEDQ